MLRARERLPELSARADTELREHLVQVVLDSARADEQLGADLRVGVALAVSWATCASCVVSSSSTCRVIAGGTARYHGR